MATPMSHESDGSSQCFCLIWLDNSVNKAKENRQAQEKFRSLVSRFVTFEDHQPCLEYIQTSSKTDRITLIVTGRLGRILVPEIVQFPQIFSIYVYCMDVKGNKEWTQHYSKVKGLFTRLDDLMQQILQQPQKVYEPLPISVFHTHEEGQSSTGLNGQFIHSQLLIDCLIRMELSPTEKQEFLDYCRTVHKNNSENMAIIEKFADSYTSKQSLSWYTRDTFLYRSLNKALRKQDIDLLYLFRFFIRDLDQQLEATKCQRAVRVYRAQKMVREEIDMLRNSIGEFISMNTFFSTSLDPEKAREFFHPNDTMTKDIERVFFEIDADPCLKNIKPFSDLTSLSDFTLEKEILFMIGSIFRLQDIKQDGKGIWNIRMVLCSGNDHQLKSLFQSMKNELGEKETDLNTLGRVLCDMGQYDQAEKYLLKYLEQLSADDSNRSHCYHTLGVVSTSKGEYDDSLKWHQKSIEILTRTPAADDLNLAASHSSIANVYQKKGDYARALESFDRALQIRKQAFTEDHPAVASCLNNIGIVYEKERKYSEALKYYEKALAIFEKHCPHDHGHLGALRNNIGNIHQLLRQYDQALEQYNLSLQIKYKALTPEHTDIAKTYRNIGLVYEKKGDRRQALTNLTKAETIYGKSLAQTHPDIVQIREDIRRVSS